MDRRDESSAPFAPPGRCERGARRLADSSGVALLSALLAVALLTLIVVEMTDATLVGSHLSRNAGNTISAQLLARSAEAVAEALLVDLKKREARKVTLAQGIGVPIPDIPVGDGSAGVVIEDEQGKLDLNEVADAAQRTALENLFEELDIDPALLESIAVWIAEVPDGGPSPDAAGECALTVPCAPPGRPLRSLDELALIKGFDPAIIERLRPYATAFSGAEGRKGVNINTARARVLTAIGCPVGSDFTAPLDGFESVEDLECDAAVERQAMLHLDSNVFSVQARGTVGDTTETLFAVVDRRGSRPKRLYWRERPVFAVAPIGVP
jgi:general secretion pathway protein K